MEKPCHRDAVELQVLCRVLSCPAVVAVASEVESNVVFGEVNGFVNQVTAQWAPS